MNPMGEPGDIGAADVRESVVYLVGRLLAVHVDVVY